MRHHLPKAAIALTLTAALLAAAGCRQDFASAPTSPSPSGLETFTPVPRPTVSSGTPSPTPTLSEHEQLVAEASDVLIRGLTITQDLYKQGGLAESEPVPAELANVMTGTTLNAYVGGLRQMHEQNVRWKAGAIVNSTPSVSKIPADKTAVVSLTFCSDGTKFTSENSVTKVSSHGAAARINAGFKRVDGKLKWFTSTMQQVKSC